MNKRAQAAMEFLMTYGWAILAAVIVVGVLWYMIGNPANLAGNNFQVSAPLVGNAMAISTTDIQLEIRNGAAESIDVYNVYVENCGTDDLSASPTEVLAGALQSFTITCTDPNAPSTGDRFSGDVTITYRSPGSGVDQSATGSIQGRVP